MAASTEDAAADATMAARGPNDANVLADMRTGQRCLFRAADNRLRRMFSKPHGKLVRYNHQLWGFKAVGALRTKMGTRSDTRVFLRRRADLHGRLGPGAELGGQPAVYCDSTGKKIAFDRIWRGFWDPARRWRIGQNHEPATSSASIAVRDDRRNACAPDAAEREAYRHPEGARPEWLSARFHSAFDAFGPGAQPTAWDVPEEPDGLVDEGFEMSRSMAIVTPEPPPASDRSGRPWYAQAFVNLVTGRPSRPVAYAAEEEGEARAADPPGVMGPMRPTSEARAMDVGMYPRPSTPGSPSYETSTYEPTSSSFEPTTPPYEPTSPLSSPTAPAPAAAAASGEAWEEYHLDADGVPHPGPAPGSTAAAAARERKDAEAEQCSICLDAPRCYVFIPCGHMTACGTCARRFWEKPCPICRKKVKAMQKVFKS